MSLTTASLLKWVFDVATGISTNIVSQKLLDAFRQDLLQVISKLILDEYQKFSRDFPDAAQPLQAAELRPAVQQHFGTLTADQIADPLATTALETLFMNFFLKPKYRAAEDFEALDPQYRNALRERAQVFRRSFPDRFTAVCERNDVAAMRLMLASLAQSGRNETEIKTLLQAIQASQIDLPAQVAQQVESGLLPFIRRQIELEMNRFRDLDFTVQYLQGKTSAELAAEKEWLEVLHQALEWSNFKDIQRRPLPGVPGLLFRMNSRDQLGIQAHWVCWGCPTASCPEEQSVRVAATYMQQQDSDKLFVISRAEMTADRVHLLEELKISSHLTLEQFL